MGAAVAWLWGRDMDQDLVQASQTAGAYCGKCGTQPMTSSMATCPADA
jgi:hypothetical protein